MPDPTTRSARAAAAPPSRQATFAEKRPSASGASGPPPVLTTAEEAQALATEWRLFGWVATAVAVLTAPVYFLLLYRVAGSRASVALVVAIIGVFAFRGLVDLIAHRLIRRPPLLASTDDALRAEDQLARRRHWFWRSRLRFVFFLGVLYVLIALIVRLVYWIRADGSWAGAFTALPSAIPTDPGQLGTVVLVAISVPLGLLINTILFIGPLVIVGIRQVKGFEPNEASWGVSMDDVRGQAGPKEEIRKIVDLWQSGDEFALAGGKRERGMLLLGPPGTGKTMTAKAIASSVNAPFVAIPGSALSQAFIGVDVLMVLYMTHRARQLARKWGGQCIIFMDEVDAVARSRFLGTGELGAATRSLHELAFHGPLGAITSTGDLIVETPAWRDRLFAERGAHGPRTLYPAPLQRVSDKLRGFLAPGLAGMGGSAALQSLLITMDGLREPRPTDRYLRTRINTWLDVTYVIPRRIGNVPLRLPPARPRDEELFFIGACNVPIDTLDPAITRPGRLGRHVMFRTPAKEDRRDIIQLYLDRVAHEEDLDSDKRRDELARITFGHSPAMIEQVCSLALAYAHHDGRAALGWADLLTAMTTVEAGIESGLQFIPAEARSIAIHEAGHAVCGHAFMEGHVSTRLSIRPRGWSLGQHVMGQVDERYSSFRREKFADLVWTFGAMAAECVFYDDTTTGVGGDVAAATCLAGMMVGYWGMAPRAPRLGDPGATERIMGRYETLGVRLMNRASSGVPLAPDPLESILADDDKRRLVAQFLGQAFATAYWFVLHNRAATEQVADTLLDRREMYGDEVVELLERVGLTVPDVDARDEAVWPEI